jgi:tRNA A37 N6-isopentenylltransferase MiaA
MFEQGLVEEVSQLIQNKESILSTSEILEKYPGLNAIGYREVIDFLT